MKNALFITLLSLTVQSFAQQTGTFDFQFINTESGVVDTMKVHIAQTTKKFAVHFSDGEIKERFVLDSIAGQVLELIDDGDTKDAFVTELASADEDGDYPFGFAFISELIMGDIATNEDYTLLADKKVIQGWECRKVNLLEEGKVVGTGWVAMGLFIGISNDSGFFRLLEGTLVELTVKEEGIVVGEMKLIQSKKTIANPTVEFSLAIPDGYELYDDEEYYDEENGDDEEE